jgi:hypothetical protein
MMQFNRLLTISMSAVLVAACGSGAADPAAGVEQSPQQAALSQTLCDLLPRAAAEKIMGKALVERRNDGWGCHYEDARGTSGTGLWLDLYVFAVSDQCRLTPGSEPLSGVGSEACIAIGHPAGLYTTVVFGGGGRTFVATAPGQDRTSEVATAVARAVLSNLGA